jgi:gluconolactonase
MKIRLTSGVIVVVLGLGVVRAQAPSVPVPTDRPFRIVKLDPALDRIVSPDARLETLGDRFGLNEGSVWLREGNGGSLLFSDMLDNVIYRWQEGRPLSVYLENAGYTGDDILNVGQQTRRGRSAVILIGPNGLTMDPQGRLVICAMPDRAVVRIEPDGTRTVLADRYQGRRFSGPNDVTVKSNGSVYFTDSVSGLRGGAGSPDREIPYNGFYLVKDGVVTLLGSDENQRGAFPNGITLSPDERYLYVTSGFQRIMRYEILPDDTVSQGEVFVDGLMGNDGMKVDRMGNLYSTAGAGPGEVRITAPDGTRLGTIELPQVGGEPRSQICSTNVSFGDADGKSLFITACTHLFRLRLETSGILPGPRR